MTDKKYLLYASQNYAFAILRPLQEEIRKRGGKVYWFFKGESINQSYLREDESALATINEVVSYEPDVVFVPGNTVPNFISGIKVAVFHGFNVEKRSNARGHFNIRGCFDLYCTQGPNTTGPFNELAIKHQHFSVRETGWPAVDSLYSAERQNNDKPVILLCSTFTPSLSCAETLYEKVKVLSASGRWQWLVQFHPKMAKTTVEKYKALQHENLTFIETDNVIPLLQQADVMVCDTSSVLSMFLLLEKPVVTFKNANPKPHMIDIADVNELESSIELALTEPEFLMNNIAEFVAQTHPYKDGKSASRVLDAADELLEGKNLAIKNKPLNIIRNYKERKSLNYWRFSPLS